MRNHLTFLRHLLQLQGSLWDGLGQCGLETTKFLRCGICVKCEKLIDGNKWGRALPRTLPGKEAVCGSPARRPGGEFLPELKFIDRSNLIYVTDNLGSNITWHTYHKFPSKYFQGEIVRREAFLYCFLNWSLFIFFHLGIIYTHFRKCKISQIRKNKSTFCFPRDKNC